MSDAKTVAIFAAAIPSVISAPFVPTTMLTSFGFAFMFAIKASTVAWSGPIVASAGANTLPIIAAPAAMAAVLFMLILLIFHFTSFLLQIMVFDKGR